MRLSELMRTYILVTWTLTVMLQATFTGVFGISGIGFRFSASIETVILDRYYKSTKH